MFHQMCISSLIMQASKQTCNLRHFIGFFSVNVRYILLLFPQRTVIHHKKMHRRFHTWYHVFVSKHLYVFTSSIHKIIKFVKLIPAECVTCLLKNQLRNLYVYYWVFGRLKTMLHSILYGIFPIVLISTGCLMHFLFLYLTKIEYDRCCWAVSLHIYEPFPPYLFLYTFLFEIKKNFKNGIIWMHCPSPLTLSRFMFFHLLHMQAPTNPSRNATFIITSIVAAAAKVRLCLLLLKSEMFKRNSCYFLFSNAIKSTYWLHVDSKVSHHTVLLCRKQ